MYLLQTFKFRFGELSDLFICNSFPQTGVRYIKEKFLYFLFIDGKIFGPYKTHRDCKEVGLAFEIYELVVDKKVLVIEPRQISQEVASDKMYMRLAKFDDLERNTLYYEYVNKNLFGPYMMTTDISDHDSVLITKINNGIIYVINEIQKFKR